MYKIRPYSEFLQEELLKFIKACPDQWQAKILLLLEFKSVLSLEELIRKTDISEVYILKALLIAEQYLIVLHMANGWILNATPDIDNLNLYLSLDVSDLDLKNSNSLKILLENKNNDSVQEKYNFKKNIISISSSPAVSSYKHSGVLYDDMSQEDRLSINDRGRKRSNEWNSNEALKLNREIKERIKKINEEKRLKEPDIINSSNIANTQKKPYSSKSEKLYIELCLDFPEYESYITRHHNLNPSYETMKIIKEKIYSDLNLDEYGR